MSLFYARTLHVIDKGVFKLTRGRTTFSAWLAGLPVAWLTTTGAKSGVERTSPVLAIPCGDGRLVVIASNYGQRHNPSWYYNLRAHPYATIASAEPAVRSWPRSSAGMTASAATGVARRA